MTDRSRSLARSAVAAASAMVVLVAAVPLHAQEDAEPGSVPLEETMLAPGYQERFADGFAKGFDLVILRQLNFVGVIIGLYAFIPAAILTSPGGRPAISAAYEVFVETPAESTFQRPLGDF